MHLGSSRPLLALVAVGVGLTVFWNARVRRVAQAESWPASLSAEMTAPAGRVFPKTAVNSPAPMAAQPAGPQSVEIFPVTRAVDELWQQPPPEPAFRRFRSWTQKFEAAGVGQKESLIEEGVGLASERRLDLKELIEAHPQRALELAVPLAVRRQLPAEVVDLLEERISGRGNFEVLGATPAPGMDARDPDFRAVQRAVVVGERRWEARVFGVREGEPTQFDVALHGGAMGSNIHIRHSDLKERFRVGGVKIQN